jgi:trehalose 6-phosphate synthase
MWVGLYTGYKAVLINLVRSLGNERRTMTNSQMKNILSLHTVGEAMQADRLIIATNRGPVEYYQSKNNTLKYRRGTGGVVTALMSLGNNMDITWVAMAMTEGDHVAVKEAHQQGQILFSPLPSKRPVQLHYVPIARDIYHNYYEKISNQLLWFLQHYLSDSNQIAESIDQIHDAWANGYSKANQAIADAVCIEIEREETPAAVMLHDYHLYLAPALIRQRYPSLVIQQFIHIPWPAIRYWQSLLPHTLIQSIYSSLLSNDILGFQTLRDANNFLEGVRTILNEAVVDFEDGMVTWENHSTRVRDYPISISVYEERRLIRHAASKRIIEQLAPHLGEQTIMRVDRIEPTKNIVQGFRAYQHLLASHPELHGKVTFLAFLVPSRQNIPRYQQYKDEVFQTIDTINQQYGSEKWKPIHALVENNRRQALAAMQFYDVLLVNPLIDGMNLVAKEGAIVNQNDGVLVLSRTAGAFQQLGKAALPISPMDVGETAEALYAALTLPPQERHRRAWLARSIVEQHDLEDWITQQISEVNQVFSERWDDDLYFENNRLFSSDEKPG